MFRYVFIKHSARASKVSMAGLGSTISQSGCAAEMYLTWNLAERERLTLYYDSAEELGRLAGFQCFFFLLRSEVSPKSSL